MWHGLGMAERKRSAHVSLSPDDLALIERLRKKHRAPDGSPASVSAIVRMALRKMAGRKVGR